MKATADQSWLDGVRRIFDGAALPIHIGAIVGIGTDHLAAILFSSGLAEQADKLAIWASVVAFAVALLVSARATRDRH